MGWPEGVRVRFDHVSIATHSIDCGVGWFQRYFPTVPRNPKQVSEQARGGFLWQDFYLGGEAVEFIEELPDRRDFISTFLARRGEGFHHLSFEVDRLDPVITALKAAGVRIVDDYDLDDGTRTAFVSPRSAFGALIQFWQPVDYNKPTPRPQPDGLVRFDHVAIAARDLNRALDFFQTNFGATLLQEPVLSATQGNFMLAQLDFAGLKLEFLQSPAPATPDDFVDRFIARFGEGMHHFTVDVKDFDGTLARLTADGVRIVGKEINWRGERQFFISPRSAFGTLIQVWDGLAGPREGSE
jgi:methylmalonyl-CoA/ethylmalonyl-CoA epimerase